MTRNSGKREGTTHTWYSRAWLGIGILTLALLLVVRQSAELRIRARLGRRRVISMYSNP
jgi:hypothetical protein